MTRVSEIRVATWNLEWATPRSRRGRTISDHLRALDADVLCLTEAHVGNFPEGYQVIEADADYGYPIKFGRRKVLIGSKWEWGEVDNFGHSELPGGRFVAGNTETPIGILRAIGVCIPWRDAHVRTGRKDGTPWSEHAQYLSGLNAIIREASQQAMVLGDFNQRLPRRRQPLEIATKLEECLGSLRLLTRGVSHEGDDTIDHLAVPPTLDGEVVGFLPSSMSGKRLSDHFGVVCAVRKRSV